MRSALFGGFMKEFAYPGLMAWFRAVSDIPRRSYHEEKIADFLVAFAKERGLFVLRDGAHNVLIRKDATAGREHEAPILLQGHTDMVCEKRDGVSHDFNTDPLQLREKDGWLFAEGTSLGADNGVAVAVMLYLLDGAEGNLVSHPPLECLFTSAEEVGLDGAKAFDYSVIAAKRMINMDSADESTVVAGCAGGLRTNVTYHAVTIPANGFAYRICVGGLAGGHSGEDIDRGRASANSCLGRLLCRLAERHSFFFVSLHGGNADNAISRLAEAVIVADQPFDADAFASEMAEELSVELVEEDKGCFVTAESVSLPETMMDRKSSADLCLMLGTVAVGVLARYPGHREMVGFSRNLGVLTASDDCQTVEMVFNSRSAEAAQIDWSMTQLNAYARYLGADIRHYNRYPGWHVAEQSPLRDAYCRAYREIFGWDAKVTALHAGLEAGIIKDRIPDLDVISCGPVVENLHSPDERMDLRSFENFFRVLCRVLESRE